ncbi:HNH endonuclease family protein [Microbacterium panaciterrae]|uniref:GmrSD restriction endonucleases C-terminal domain-containing protein n=1 Tax=Microbacterium panaciterrae TaxID=985759 RepID=A0ABP8PTA9_9MICO
MNTRVKTTGVLALAAVALTLAGMITGTLRASTPHAPTAHATTPAQASTPATSAPSAAQPDPGAQNGAYAEALALAAALPLTVVDPAQPVPPYSRPKFGPAWADVDHNGCRQRDDMLARDLVDVVKDTNGCTVLTGVLERDPYTGRRIVFQHDRVAEPGNKGSSGVQGEHIVSLKAAWVGGAWAWSDQRRLEFANNLADVIAVDGSANESKGEDGPAAFIPKTYYRCTYVTKYTQIVHTWEITVPKADRDALVAALTECEAGR